MPKFKLYRVLRGRAYSPRSGLKKAGELIEWPVIDGKEHPRFLGELSQEADAEKGNDDSASPKGSSRGEGDPKTLAEAQSRGRVQRPKGA